MLKGCTATVLAALLQVPRKGVLQLLCYTQLTDLGVCAWLPLLTFHVVPQAMHIIDIG